MRIDQADGDDEPPDAADAPPRADRPAETRSESERRGELPDAHPRAARVAEDRARVDAAYRTHAIDRGYERVREIERETVTPAMKRIEAEDPDRHLVGLENRLKGRDRLAEKVESDVQKKGLTIEQAIGNVKDAVRYTFSYSEGRYTAGVYADCERLKAEGFELVERRNSWPQEQYKGLNSRWRVPGSGQVFEVQFHTQASFEAKQETHWAYEKLRVGVPTPTEQRELEDFQKRVTAGVPVPSGAAEIPDYP
ncbi:MAG TPA: hypothetical protein VHF26_12485 [Trebonia sp.]|nr:hypothetical protein [Trebonia sp.]